MKYTFINKYFVSVLLLILIITSCNSRQVRVASKVLHEVEHMSEETEVISNDNLFEDDLQMETAPAQEVKYAISGIYQREDGTIDYLRENIVIQTSQGLYLADGIGRPTDPVYKNDTQTITETRIVSYSFDEDETELRPYNVSGYAYKCFNGVVTFYFNIGSRIN